MILRILICAFMAAGVAACGVLDVQQNFNSPNNPLASTAFSYWIGNGLGAVSPLATGTQNCLNPSLPSYCWTAVDAANMTSIADWNGSGADYINGSIHLPTNMVLLDPQGTVGTILEFTAPDSANYTVQGLFDNVANVGWGVYVSIYANGVQFLPTTRIGRDSFNLPDPAAVPFSYSNLWLSAGQTLDFVVVPDSRGFAFNSTGLTATIESSGGAAGDPVPEPASLFLLLPATAAILLLRRRRA